MFCSTIIPTIGRPTLTRAVESVLNQEFAVEDFEVVVVNDSGKPLPDAEWQRSEKVQIIATNRHNRSVARNAGAAIARGRHLHFLDDDDWLLPGAFDGFWELARTTCAAWLYGGFRLVDNAEEIVAEVQPDQAGNCFIQVVASEWLPLQASLIDSKAFFAVGGFASLPSLLGGYEDIDLLRQIAQHYEIARVAQVVASIRAGDRESTTDYANMFNQNRQSREKMLNTPGAFTRMRESARASTTDSAYWYGRIVYYYLASMRWNLRHKRLFVAASRSAYSIASFAIAGWRILSTSFWRGVLRPHHNQVRNAIDQLNFKWY